ncbi:MAG TPA: hypothetical protein VLD19_03650, partial [Chitinophagaceae bacterium]|nr:hypothetical protein [Chitinophagaceae bacterium]
RSTGGTTHQRCSAFVRELPGQKASNKWQQVGARQTNIRMWNNTFIACGYRQIQSGRDMGHSGLMAQATSTIPGTV